MQKRAKNEFFGHFLKFDWLELSHIADYESIDSSALDSGYLRYF